MDAEPRPYRDDRDRLAIEQLLARGRMAGGGAYYVHPGDLRWWIYYALPDDDLRPYLYLWEQDGQLIGWSLLSRRDECFDVFMAPEYHGAPQMERAYAWAIERGEQVMRRDGSVRLHKYWNLAGDAPTTDLLARHGFQPSSASASFRRDLHLPVSSPRLPDGFCIRPCRG
ncbi:MAG: hypothetical protein ACKOC5_10565, partial [Chloroflexota bacterium]